MEIKNSAGDLCACFGILVLEEEFMNQFIAGKVKNTQLTYGEIKNITNAKKSSRLYISGVVVRDSSTFKGSKRARVMVWAILNYIKKLYGFRKKREVFALAVNKESSNMMKKMGFSLVKDGKHRADKCDLFKIDFDKGIFEKMAVRLGDYSKVCDLKLN